MWMTAMSECSGETPGDIVVPGEKVYLGPIRRDLAPEYRRWLNDLRFAGTLGVVRDQSYPITDEDQHEWFDATRKDDSVAAFTIYERATGNAVGNVALMNVRSLNRSAELGIGIGDRSKQGKGYGTEAVRLVCDYGFTLLNLHRIWLECVDFNIAGIRAYEKVGFREVGRARDAWLLGGKRYDGVIMDILAHEFQSPVLREMLGLPARGPMRQGEEIL
jgi:diamine N-acetyltransferase